MSPKLAWATIVVCLLFSVSLVFIPAPSKQTPELTYSVSGCEEQREMQTYGFSEFGQPEITTQGNQVMINHGLNYYCCAQFEFEWEQKGDTIIVTETNTGEPCFCMCDYNLNLKVAPLGPGTYRVQVFGIADRFRDAELLAEKGVVV